MEGQLTPKYLNKTTYSQFIIRYNWNSEAINETFFKTLKTLKNESNGEDSRFCTTCRYIIVMGDDGLTEYVCKIK